MNWLLGVQGLLFAALGSLKDGAPLVPGLVYSSLRLGSDIDFRRKSPSYRVDRAIRNVLANWNEHLRSTKQRWQDYPRYSRPPSMIVWLMGLDRFLSPRILLPWAFALGWLVILVLKLKG